MKRLKSLVNSKPINTTTDIGICEGDSIELHSLVTTTGASNLKFYNNLLDAQSEINPVANTTVAPNSTSDYFVVSTSTENCKSNIETIKITVNTIQLLLHTDTSICEGDSIELQSLVTTIGTTSLAFYNNLSDAQNEIDPIANTSVAPTTTSELFCVKYFYRNCKSAIETIKITVNSKPINTTTDISICEGDSIDLQNLVTATGTSSLAFYINPSDAQSEINLIANTSVAPTTTSDYYVEVLLQKTVKVLLKQSKLPSTATQSSLLQTQVFVKVTV